MSQCWSEPPLECLASHSCKSHPQSYNPSRGLEKGGRKKRWLCTPLPFLCLTHALLFPHLTISYSCFNLQLERYLWAFSSFSRALAPPSVPSRSVVSTSITAVITQCANDLLKLWASLFVFPILIIAILLQRGHTWGMKHIPRTIRQEPAWESKLWQFLFPERGWLYLICTHSDLQFLIFNC